MSSLLPYVQKAIMMASLASSGYNAARQPQPKTHTCFFWIGASLATVSYVLIMGGFGLYLASNYDLPIALMVTGLTILFTILIVTLVIRYFKNLHQRRMQMAIRSATDDVTSALGELTDDVAGAFKDNAGIVAMVVGLIGFLTARKI